MRLFAAFSDKCRLLILTGFLTMALSGCGVTVNSSNEPSPTPTPGPTPTPTPVPFPTPILSIEVEPDSLRYGSVDVGTAVTKTVAFNNVGETTFTLKELYIFSPIPFFAVGTLSSDKLEPGKSLLVDVTFSPGQTGSFSGKLELLTEEAPVPTVALTGTGVPPATPTPTPSPTPGP